MADDLPPLQCRNVKKIWCLNLPGTPWATSACCGRPLLYFTFTIYSYCYVYVFLLLCMLCSVYSVFIAPNDILRLPWLRVFRAFSSVVRQMPEYTSQRRGTARTLPRLIVLFYVLFVCKCVLCYCHRVATQLQLINISYHIIMTGLYGPFQCSPPQSLCTRSSCSPTAGSMYRIPFLDTV